MAGEPRESNITLPGREKLPPSAYKGYTAGTLEYQAKFKKPPNYDPRFHDGIYWGPSYAQIHGLEEEEETSTEPDVRADMRGGSAAESLRRSRGRRLSRDRLGDSPRRDVKRRKTLSSSEISASEAPNSSQVHAMVNDIKAHRQQEPGVNAAKRSASPLMKSPPRLNASILPSPGLPPVGAKDNASIEERRGRPPSVRSYQPSRELSGPSIAGDHPFEQVERWTHMMSPTGPRGARCPSESGSIRSITSGATGKTLEQVSSWNQSYAQAERAAERAADQQSLASPRRSLERYQPGDGYTGKKPEYNPASERVEDAWHMGATTICTIGNRDAQRWGHALHGPDCRMPIPEYRLPGHAYGGLGALGTQDRSPSVPLRYDAYSHARGSEMRPPSHAYTAAKGLAGGQYSWVLGCFAQIIIRTFSTPSCFRWPRVFSVPVCFCFANT